MISTSGLTKGGTVSEVPDCQMYGCHHCWYKAKNKLSLEDHIRIAHLVERPFACDKCNFRAIKKSHLSQHMKVHVLNVYGCSLCDFKSYERESVKRHLRTHNKDMPSDHKANEQIRPGTHLAMHSREKPHQCAHCDYRTKDRDRLTAHLATHTGEKLFLCGVCAFRTTCRKNLQKHNRLKHGDKPHACEQCDFRSTSESALRNHALTHTGNRQFTCNLCSFSCHSKSDIAAHKKLHSSENGVTCTYCPYTVKKNYDMRRHIMKVHSTDKKRFKCKECQYRTSDKRAMKKHKRVHTGQKPFACSVCEKTYNRRPTLQEHVVRNHTRLESEGKYECSICNGTEIFSSQKVVDVAKHVLSSHTSKDVVMTAAVESQPVEATPILLENVNYVCNTCEHKSDNVTDMAKHMLSVHSATEAATAMVVTTDSSVLRSFLAVNTWNPV